MNRARELANDPHPHNSRIVHGRMDGESRVYRIRSGDYRILYSVNENTGEILILDIGHRKNVYR